MVSQVKPDKLGRHSLRLYSDERIVALVVVFAWSKSPFANIKITINY
jgi:hypothetical protein